MVLITGSSGFVGQALMHAFGKRAIGLQRRIIDQNPTNIYECDLSNEQSVTAVIKKLSKHSISHIVHAAAITPWSEENDYRADLIMAELVLKLSNELAIPKIIFLSGWNVYDPKDTVPISENSKTKPVDPYGASKLEVEKLLLSHANGLHVLNLRAASLYGPGQLSKGLIPNLATKALKGETLTIGSSQTKRDYLYIEDFVNAIQNLVEKKTLQDYRYLNIGSGSSVSVIKVAQIVQSIFQDKYGINLQIEINDNTISMPADNLLDIDRVKREGILQKYTPIEKGIANYIAWRRNENIL